MIKKPSRYDDVQVGSYLEPGGYILRIKRIDYEPEKNYLKLGLDIDEGPFKDYFEGKTYNDGRWCNDANVYLSFNDSEGAIKATKGNISAIERSNENYVWDWNEKSLLHKKVGGVFGLKEYQAQDGSIKTKVVLRRLRSIPSILNGDFKIPDVEKLDENYIKTDSGAVSSFMNAKGLGVKTNKLDFEISEDDLPF